MCKKNLVTYIVSVISVLALLLTWSTLLTCTTYIHSHKDFFSEEVFDHLLEKLFALKGQHSTKLFKNFMSLRKNSGCQQDEFIS